MFWSTSRLVTPVMTRQRAINPAALSTSRREKNSAFGLPVVPLDVCNRNTSSGATASSPAG